MAAAASAGVEIVHRSCPICEASCGLRVHVERAARRVLRIDGDDADPRSRGYLCPKATALQGVFEDPDRVRRPLRKNAAGDFEEISFEEAFRFAGEKLSAIRDAHGPDAIGVFFGEPGGHDLGALLYNSIFMRALGTRRAFSSATMDQFPKNVTLKLMIGDGWMFVVPDIDRCDLFICMGGNPLASQGSIMACPDVGSRLRAIQQRGGRVIAIDPRRSETAELADEHVFIKPGSDAYFLFALIHVLFEERLVRLGRFAAFTDGVDEVRALAREFSPEAVAAVTGIAPEVTRRLAREYAGTPRAALYGRIGTCTQEFGTLASWLLDVAAILTGHFDEVGCMMFPRPATGNSEPGPEAAPLSVGAFRTVARGLPEIDGQLPAGAMAEEIEERSAGAQRMRALITSSANPVLSAPNGDRLARALGELDFMLSIDIYVNETTSHADLILPTTSQLEHDNYDLIYQTTACRNFARWSPQVFEPEPGLRHHWEVFLGLASAITGAAPELLDDAMLQGIAQQRVGPGSRRPEVAPERAIAAVGGERGPMRLLDLMLRAGPYGDGFDDSAAGLSLRAVQVPHAVDLGPLTPRLPEVLKTPGRRIPLAPPYLTADVERLRRRLPERAADTGFLLVGRRQLRNMNSWLHNLPKLAKGRTRCTLLIHPEDAARLGIANGALARVRSRSGELRVEAEVSDEIMRGVVSLPHGFGHARPGNRTAVASRLQPGANANQLTDELPLDLPSGTHIANGIPVQVEAA